MMYHIVLAIRRSLPKSRALGFFCDILFCSAAGFAVTFAMMYYNYAQIRGFLFLGMILGAVLYFFTLGRLFLPLFSLFWKYFFKIFGFILKILLTPVRFLHKIIMIPLHMAGKLLCAVKAAVAGGFRRIINDAKKKIGAHRSRKNQRRKTKKENRRRHPGRRRAVRGNITDNGFKRHIGAAGDKPRQSKNRRAERAN